MNGVMEEMQERFTKLANRVHFGKPAEAPPPRKPQPEEVEAAKLEGWAQDTETRVHYIEHLNRRIEDEERAKTANMAQPDFLRYHLGRLDALREERAWILKIAGLANGPR